MSVVGMKVEHLEVTKNGIKDEIECDNLGQILED